MKEIYVCEKCGAQFTSYDDAYKCEDSHKALAIGGEFRPEIRSRQTYANGGILPSKTVLASEEYTVWNEETRTWDSHYVFGEYKLVRMLSDADAEKLMQEQKERLDREQREYEEWVERYNAEKAAREAEEQSA